MILLIMDFCGVFCMISYTAKIFTESGTEFHPNQAAVVVGFIQLIGTYVSTITVDHVGRKVSSTESGPYRCCVTNPSASFV